MSTTSTGRSNELATVDRSIADTPRGYEATLTVESAVETPLVVRIVDELPAHPAIDGIQLHPETEPARWGIQDHALVLELAAEPASQPLVRYDIDAETLPEAAPSVRVDLAQPVDGDDLASEDGVPAFRDAMAFSAEPAGTYVATSEPPSEDEASDDDVRRAIQAISEPEPTQSTVSKRPTLDLADPPD